MERSIFPRPDFIRRNWISLSGEWDFSFGGKAYDRKINVPFCPESAMSGIGKKVHDSTMWYRRKFSFDKKSGQRVILHFGAVDHYACVYVNGKCVGSHRGGYSPFSFDITDVVEKDNTLEVFAEDNASPYELEGKQRWGGSNFGCWYTEMSGIWQEVWIEEAGVHPIAHFMITPSALTSSASIYLKMMDSVSATIDVTFSIRGSVLGTASITTEYGEGHGSVSFQDIDVKNDDYLWSPEHPNLIDVDFSVREDGGDEVSSYFGLRDIAIKDKAIYLNRSLLFQRLVLDQGYWKESLYTPPSYEAIVKDIELAKAMGFNGVRKHQKIEDPKFYYAADKMGLLVWEELPSWHRFSPYSAVSAMEEACEMVMRDCNHPSIIAWVPLNESWGVSAISHDKAQQSLASAMYRMIKALDGTRFISTNDGWEQVEDTDIYAIHDYAFSSQCENTPLPKGARA